MSTLWPRTRATATRTHSPSRAASARACFFTSALPDPPDSWRPSSSPPLNEATGYPVGQRSNASATANSLGRCRVADAAGPRLRAGGGRVALEDYCGEATCVNPAGMWTWFTMLTSDSVRGSHVRFPVSFKSPDGPNVLP